MTAWTAVETEAVARGGGTSKEDVKAYAAVGGAAAGTAACTAITAGAGAVVAPACGAIGAAIGEIVGGAIYDLGESIFGGSSPDIADTTNPVVDRAIKSIVDKLRSGKGLPIASPPGGSTRNWPEWDGVASIWAHAANKAAADAGASITWWYESGPLKAGRIRGAAMDELSSTLGNGFGPQRLKVFTRETRAISAAIVTATQQAAVAVLVAPGVARIARARGGQAAKPSLLPLGAALAAIGAAVVWAMLRRKKSQ